MSNWNLSSGDTTTYYYQISLGGSFNCGQVVAGGASVLVLWDGVLAANLANPSSAGGQLYTVWISIGLFSGCGSDSGLNQLRLSTG